TSGQAARRDTSATSRPAPRDTARAGTGQRVATGQPARRDTASARPAPRDTTTRRNDAGRTGAGGATTTGRAGSTTGTSTSTAGTSTRGRSHTVSAGETFYAIARRYGVTPAQLRALNPDVDMNALEVGDVLRLPAGARDRNAAQQARQQQGGAQQPARGSRTHTVAAGETLFGIARRYGVTVEAIRRANEMETDQVRAGQRLVIPPAR
ncbi:MAG TPA: LysM peptidoglycan-binding domain-containing protein, partial [Longimicrobium sp.]|nr:LysM peptidoglycan-binding domain-containing protein [Longimicrobium sp.]